MRVDGEGIIFYLHAASSMSCTTDWGKRGIRLINVESAVGAVTHIALIFLIQVSTSPEWKQERKNRGGN